MKQTIFAILMLFCITSQGQFDGYVRGVKLKQIFASKEFDGITNAQLETYWVNGEGYKRLILSFGTFVERVEIQDKDQELVPLSAPSITFILDFLEYNGLEKTSVNEDVDNKKVTIFLRRIANTKKTLHKK